MLLLGAGLSACDGGKQPELMKAVKQFKSDEIRDGHVKNMRINHMDELLHKRDETMIKGIRTKKHSLKACINCHVPEQHEGKEVRHTDPEHFCSTCHGYVAQQLDCFQCHTDRPNSGNKVSKVAPNDSTHENVQLDKQLKSEPLNSPSEKHLPSDVSQLNVNSVSNNAPKQPVGEK